MADSSGNVGLNFLPYRPKRAAKEDLDIDTKQKKEKRQIIQEVDSRLRYGFERIPFFSHL